MENSKKLNNGEDLASSVAVGVAGVAIAGLFGLIVSTGMAMVETANEKARLMKMEEAIQMAEVRMEQRKVRYVKKVNLKRQMKISLNVFMNIVIILGTIGLLLKAFVL